MSDDTNFGLSRIGQIAVTAHDIDGNFYRDKFAIKRLFSLPPKAAFFDCGGIMGRHHLDANASGKPEFDHPGSIIYFTVRRYWITPLKFCSNRGIEFVELCSKSHQWRFEADRERLRSA